jgi:dipeptidase
MAYVPPKDYAANSSRPVFLVRLDYPRHVGADRSEVYAAEPGQTDFEPIGFIPQVEHTYGYWEATYPLLNEHGLGFGESTCGALLVGQSVSDGGNALMSIAELMRVAMERCQTARCAINLMGELAERYGFYGEDPGPVGAGEHLSVTDREETWVFEISSGFQNTSATWVAQRVPDGHLAVCANNFIVRNVDCQDTDNFMCGSDLLEKARALGQCSLSNDKDLDWLACFAPDKRYFSDVAGRKPAPHYTTLRMWRVQTLANPDIYIAPGGNPLAFPFSVPVKNRLSRSDVMDFMRDHYEGTEFDMTQGILAGPFGTPNRIEGGPGIMQVQGEFTRAISIPRTVYGLLIEPKPIAGQSIAWFATDTPSSSVFVPFFASATECAEPYSKGRIGLFSRDSAWWAFTFVANWMNLNYRDMKEQYVGPKVKDEQRQMIAVVESLEHDWPETDSLNAIQMQLQGDLVRRWWEFGDVLVAAFNDGVHTSENGTQKTYGYPAWWLQMIGFDNDAEWWRPQWVQWASLPPLLLQTKSSIELSEMPSVLPQSPLTSFAAGILAGVAGCAVVSFVSARKPQRVGLAEPLF